MTEISKGEVMVLTWAGEPEKADVLSALGVLVNNPDHLEVFDQKTIAPIGLAAYLADGHGIDPEELRPSMDRLEALRGTLAVLSARAFADSQTVLSLGEGLAVVASFREAAAAPAAPKAIEAESAKGQLAGGQENAPKSDARIGGMVAMVVLLFLALFVILFVWMAG